MTNVFAVHKSFFFFILCLHFLFPAAFRTVANPTRMLLARFYRQVITWTILLQFCWQVGNCWNIFFPLTLLQSFHNCLQCCTKFLSTVYIFLFSAAGRNVANPTAMLLASAKMLEHLGLHDEAFKLKAAVNKVLEDQKVRTRDLGGFASTTQFTQAVVDNLGKASM